MKYTAILLPVILIFASCGNPHSSDPSADTLSHIRDSIYTDSLKHDSILHIQAAKFMNHTDRNFIDFIYAFTLKPYYQMARIKFPLTCISSGDTTFLTANQWIFTRLHLAEPVYTVIYDSPASLNLSADSTILHISIERFDLDNLLYMSYEFSKEHGHWWMNAISKNNLFDYPDNQFVTFLHHFATDSLFQLSHLKPHLRINLSNTYEEMGEMNGMIDRGQWPMFRPELPLSVITNINYGQTSRLSRKRIVTIESSSDEFFCLLYFTKENNQWKLFQYDN